MRVIPLIVATLVLASSAFSFSNPGLLKADRTAGYYVLDNLERSLFSSGLTYSQKQNDKLSLEANYTCYRSLFIISNNITKLSAYEKYRLLEFGPVSLYGSAGIGIIYSTAAGGGVTFNAGPLVTAKITDRIAAIVPIYFIFFSDGFQIDASPSINFVPGIFNDNLELYLGGKIEAQMVGSFASSTGQNTDGKASFYGLLGVRAGLF